MVAAPKNLIFLLSVLFTILACQPESGTISRTFESKKQNNWTLSELLWFEDESNAQATWAPFGTAHSVARSFESWAQDSRAQLPLPDFRNKLSLNCWEYVLYVALKFKRITKLKTQDILNARKRGENISGLIGTKIGLIRYSIKNGSVKAEWPKATVAGDLIFMDETSHVVQTTGRLDTSGRMEIISFSPRPIWGDGSAERPIPSTKPQITTIESLIEEMIELYPDVPSDWNQINLTVVRPR